MKITAQEEYGLRLLIRIAGCTETVGLSNMQLANAEGLSQHYAAKLTRLLRIGGFIKSNPGNVGGYLLARPASEIIINDVLKCLGGALFTRDQFCNSHSGILKLCTNSVDCTSRSLWQMIQSVVDSLLDKITLEHLINTESGSDQILYDIVNRSRIASGLPS